MAFQPFGFPFEVTSELGPAQAKASIEKRLKGWFDAKNGARGWIAGPYICLWFSALDRSGPMLLGRIAPHGSGSRISGRAGSDLNGVAFAVPVVLGGVIIIAVSMISSGHPRGEDLRFFLIMAVVLALGLWAGHAFRKEAEPLVRFLRATVGEQAPPRIRPALGPLTKRLSLNLDGTDLDKAVDAAAIEEALLDIGAGGFLILASAEEVYVQTASEDGLSYILEWRDGGAERHFRARRSSASKADARERASFSSDEVLLALMAFATDTPMPGIVTWEPMGPRAQR